MPHSAPPQHFDSFSDFYPYYLTEHQHPHCRRLHLLGSALVIVTLITSVATGQWLGLLALPVIGYGFAWLGHLVFEKNRPATFSHPWYSFIADWVMAKDILLGRIPR